MDGQKRLTCPERLMVDASTNDYLSGRGASGIMGVPISFLEKFCPDQFEILWLDGPDQTKWYGRGPSLNGKNVYRRIFIKHKGRK